MTKVQWLFWKMYDSLGCVFSGYRAAGIFIDCTEVPKVLGPVRRVRSHKSYGKHPRKQRIGKNQVKVLYQRSHVPAETRGDWAKNIFKLKETVKTTFFPPTNEWCLQAPSVIKTRRKRVLFVDSGASMHMFSRKRPELCRIGKPYESSKSPDGRLLQPSAKCKQKKKRQCMSKNWILFVTVKLSRRYTRQSLSLGKLCEDHCEPVVRNSTHQRWQTNKMQHGKLRTDRCPLVYRQ